MKYMGHKGKLLPVLGDVLSYESRDSQRVADPFCGSAAVSWFLAQKTKKIVVSGDLQSFAVARAAAVVRRTSVIDPHPLIDNWFRSAKKIVNTISSNFPNAHQSIQPDLVSAGKIKTVVLRSRKFCQSVLPTVLSQFDGDFPITLAYGGHYFSPLQALELDALRQSVPNDPFFKDVCIAALVEAASKCAAAPGHTAQPFQPTVTAARYIIEAWSRDVWSLVEQAATEISSLHASAAGTAEQGDYLQGIAGLEPGDLVFADPPYSDVHYSRFYHVLETLARGVSVNVSGVGRYPPLSERPPSSFSRKGESHSAARALVEFCAKQELGLVLTFPSSQASNGLAAADFISYGKKMFSSIEVIEVNSTFSTLGGGGGNRGGRKECKESIVCFRHS
ncbi:TPA: DNA adenine methylase [Pseudomonas aeruginosa]|nr:DNA adenine methylase [Pseudomonas aeruginosa]HCL3271861.1 DNA adenine methylase [Pseudomonas aeruginosa]